MKNILSIILIVVAGSVSGQPNKIESVLLENNNLFQINTNGTKIPKGSVMFSPSLLLDANGNWKIKPDVVAIDNLSDNNVVFAFREATIKNSDNNTITGENIYLENVIGSFISVTDGTIKNTMYATVTGDANNGQGEGYRMSGFGNANTGDYNSIDGLNNSIGIWGTNRKYNYSSAVGTRVIVLNDYVHATGFNTLFVNKGWGYGYNGVRFWVYEDGKVEIGGVKYQFPTVAPQVGDVLTCVAPGVLGWGNQNVTQTKAVTVKSNQTVPIYSIEGKQIGYATFKF